MTNEEKERFFLENINKDDPLQIVVRGHLFLENELINLLESTFPQKECLDPSDLRFPIKIKLAGALGLLSKDCIPVFLKLNSLRNKLAHNLEMKITLQEVENLISSMSEFQTHIFWNRKIEIKVEENPIESLRDIISIMFVQLTKAVESIKNSGYIITNGIMGRRIKGILINYNLKLNDDLKQKYGVNAYTPEDLQRIKRIKKEIGREKSN